MIRVLAVLATIGSLLPVQVAGQTKALLGATVIDGTGAPAIENGVVVATGDRLACVGTRSQCVVRSGAVRVDVSGRFITPGLAGSSAGGQRSLRALRPGGLDARARRLSQGSLGVGAVTAGSLRALRDRWPPALSTRRRDPCGVGTACASHDDPGPGSRQAN